MNSCISNNSVSHIGQKTFLVRAIRFRQTVLIQTLQFSTSRVFVHIQLTIKTVLFQTIHFSVSIFSMSKQFYFKQFSLA